MYNTEILSILEGVPHPEDVGRAFLRISFDQGPNDVMELIVDEEVGNPCAERNTLWMEILFNVSLHDLNVSQQMRIVDSISEYFDISR